MSEKNRFKPWLRESWCIPPKANAEFVCAMEDVLEVYHRRFEDNEVLVCLDETSKQLVEETRTPLPARPGAAKAYDYEYRRNGVSNLFMLFAPLEGWRRVEVTERRTKTDWAAVVRKLVDEDYPEKDRIVLVMDNLNTHHPSSLYEAFEPGEARAHCGEAGDTLHAEARQLAEHGRERVGGWPGMPGPLIPGRDVLKHETRAWQGQRNRDGVLADWDSPPRTPSIRAQVPLPINTAV